MEPIKIFVEVPDDKQTVILGAEFESGGDKDVRHYLLTPEGAVEIANSLLHAAEVCGVEVHVQTYNHVSDLKRVQLIARTGHIMRSMSGRKAERIAVQIVDSILAEVL